MRQIAYNNYSVNVKESKT